MRRQRCAGGPARWRIAFVVAHVAIGEVQERAQAAHRQRRVSGCARPRATPSGRPSRARIHSAIRSRRPSSVVVGAARRLAAARAARRCARTSCSSKLMSRSRKHRERRAAGDRPRAPFGAVLLGRHGLERVDRPAGRREDVARAGVRLLGAAARRTRRGRAQSERAPARRPVAPSRVPRRPRARWPRPRRPWCPSSAPRGARGRGRRPSPRGRLAELGAKVDGGLADVGARAREDAIEQLIAASGSASAARGQTPQERGGRAGIAIEQPLRKGAMGELEPPLRGHGDVGRDRRRRAPPLGRRQRRGESAASISFVQRRHPRREKASRDGEMAPDERLAVAEQPLPGRGDRVAPLNTRRLWSSPCAARRATSLAARSRSRAASRREGSAPVDDSPIHSRARSRREARASASGPSAMPRPIGSSATSAIRARIPGLREPAAAPERHAARNGHERGRVGGEEAREDATADLALLGAHRAARRRARRAPHRPPQGRASRGRRPVRPGAPTRTPARRAFG